MAGASCRVGISVLCGAGLVVFYWLCVKCHYDDIIFRLCACHDLGTAAYSTRSKRASHQMATHPAHLTAA